MIVQIDSSNRKFMTDILAESYRLRHQVFVDEMRWTDLRREDGKETDQFDLPEAIEFACIRDNKVVGYSRLLPTTGPHLLADVFPQLCDAESPRGTGVWEWSRYAIRRDLRGDGSAPSETAVQLGIALVEWGLENDVRSFVAEMNPIQLLRFALCHFRAYPLGVTHIVGGSEIIAIQADFDERTLERLKTIRDGALARRTRMEGRS